MEKENFQNHLKLLLILRGIVSSCCTFSRGAVEMEGWFWVECEIFEVVVVLVLKLEQVVVEESKATVMVDVGWGEEALELRKWEATCTRRRFTPKELEVKLVWCLDLGCRCT